jgi:hypothetical protein
VGESQRDFKRFVSFLNNLDTSAPGSPGREEYSVVDETSNPAGNPNTKADK